MTNELQNQASLIVAATTFLESLSADDVQEWLTQGFRSIVRGAQTTQPFGIVRFAYPQAEDITDVLAAAYYDLKSAASLQDTNAFTRGLEAAFRGLSPHQSEDQRILIDLLRVATKINYSRLLPHIGPKLFRDSLENSDSAARLRSVALDAAIELSSQSPHAIASLHDVIASKLFRPSAARTMLLALCSAEPNNVIDHLCRLEKPLIAMFGDVWRSADEAMWRRRALLLADILRFTSTSVVLGLVEFCLQNRTWELAWLGEIFLDPDRFNHIPAPDAERLIDSFESFPGHQVVQASLPSWRKPMTQTAPSLEENRRQTDILQSGDSTPDEEEEVSQSVIARLASSSAGGQYTDPLFRAFVMEEVQCGKAA